MEDFNTEIVAQLFRLHPDVALCWLRWLKVTRFESVPAHVEILPQYALEALPGRHDAGSRVDLVIRLRNENGEEVFFVESKIGSSENEGEVGQLTKYLDHLNHDPKDSSRRVLIYITRDYEPKPELQREICGNGSSNAAGFMQTRWFEFHRMLCPWKLKSDLVAELMRFMEANQLSQDNCFTALDIVALTNHRHARTLMEATLGDRVAERFQQETRAYWTRNNRAKEIVSSNAFQMIGHPSSLGLKVWLGYWFPDESPNDAPNLGIYLGINQKCQRYSEIADAMNEFCSKSRGGAIEWSDAGIDEGYFQIASVKKLTDFLSGKNHAGAIANWFIQLLEEFARFKEINPTFEWFPDVGVKPT